MSNPWVQAIERVRDRNQDDRRSCQVYCLFERRQAVHGSASDLEEIHFRTTQSIWRRTGESSEADRGLVVEVIRHLIC